MSAETLSTIGYYGYIDTNRPTTFGHAKQR